MKHALILCAILMSPVLVLAGSDCELVRNANFMERSASSPNMPNYWAVGGRFFGTPAVSFPADSKTKSAVCKIDTTNCDVATIHQSLKLSQLAGEKVSLKARLKFDKLPAKKVHEFYLRIRQFSKLGYQSDVARVWVRVYPDKLVVQSWKDGRPDPPETIKVQVGKSIDIESTGIVAEKMTRYELFMTAGPMGNKKLPDDSMRVSVSNLSARQIVPPVLEISRLSRIWTTDNKHAAFTVKVNAPRKLANDKTPAKYTLKVAVELYNEDMLMYRGEQSYALGSKQQSCKFPTAKLSPGKYVLMFDLADASGKALASEVLEVEVISGPFAD